MLSARRRAGSAPDEEPLSPLSTAAQLRQAPNPFVPTTFGRRATPYEFVRAGVVACTLLPIRVIGIALTLPLAWGLSYLAVLNLSKDAMRQPLPWYRRLVVLGVRLCLRIILFWHGFYYVKEKGEPVGRGRAPIIVANHHGFFEPAYLAYRYGACFVGAGENMRLPVVREFARAFQVVSVERHRADSRKAVTEEIRRRAGSPASFPQLVIFPEGTTTNGKALVSFKPGAFAPGVSVQPVLIRFPHAHFDPSWVYGNPGLLGIALGSMLQLVNFMEVEYLPPYSPSDEERKDALLYTHNVRTLMAGALGIPLTGHTLDDVALQTEAVRLRLSPEIAVVQFGGLAGRFDIDRDGVKAALAEFKRLDRSKRDAITLEDWLAGMGDQDRANEHMRPALERVFELIDRDERGAIAFRDWLVANLLMKQAAGGRDRAAAEAFAWMAIAGDLEAKVPKEHIMRMIVGGPRLRLTQERADVLWKEADVNRDGQLEFREFQTMVRKYPEILDAFTETFLVRSVPVAADGTAQSFEVKRDGSVGITSAGRSSQDDTGVQSTRPGASWFPRHRVGGRGGGSRNAERNNAEGNLQMV